MHLLSPQTVEKIARENSPYTTQRAWNTVSEKTRVPWRNIARMTIDVISKYAVVIELPDNDQKRDIMRLVAMIGNKPNVSIGTVIDELKAMEKSSSAVVEHN